MRRSRFSATDKIRIVELASTGLPVEHICRRFDISPATFYRWQREQRSSLSAILERLERLARSESTLKSLLAQRERELEAMRDVLRGKT